MHSKTAIALAVLGLLLLGLGIGQRTLWLPPATVTAAVAQGVQGGPVTVIDSSLRTIRGGPVTVSVKSNGKILLAVGRSDDVEAWVGKAAHLSVDGVDSDFKSLTSRHVDGEAQVPNPAGSDLWTHEETGSGTISYKWTAPAEGDWSLLLAKDGTAAAPTDISITAANDTSTPWAVPLMVIGALILAISILMLAFRPRNPQARGTGSRSGRRAAPRRGRPTRSVARDAAALMATLLLAGAVAPAANAAPSPSPSASPAPAASPAAPVAPSSSAASPTPSPADTSSATTAPTSSAATPPSPTAAVSAVVPVVLDSQFSRILNATASAVNTGDAAKDSSQLMPRVAGAALALRTANYKIRSQVAGYAAIAPVTSSELLTKVISTDRSWPRDIMAVTQGAKNPVPQLLTMVQQSARGNYQLISATPLLPGQTFPTVDKYGTGTAPASDAPASDAAAGGGAASDKAGLQLSPDQALAALGDRLSKANSQWKGRIPDSPYISDVLSYQSQIIKDSPDGKFTFAHVPVAGNRYVFRTADGGAIVIGYLSFTVNGTPKTSGAKLHVASDAAVFSGGKETSTGMTLSFGESVVLYVPNQGSKSTMTLLAATRGLVGAKFK